MNDSNGDCPCCRARWFGWLSFCWNCGWWRGDPIRKVASRGHDMNEYERQARERGDFAHYPVTAGVAIKGDETE